MSMQNQIAEKIRAMSEPNRKIEEETKEAEKKLAEGCRSEPKVEQVHPGPGKRNNKTAKPVSVRRTYTEAVPPAGDRVKEQEKPERNEAEPHIQAEEKKTAKTEADSRIQGSSLGKSLQSFEDLLLEAGDRSDKPKKDASYVNRQKVMPEKNVPADEVKTEGRDIKTTVRTNPRDRGYHAVHRRILKEHEKYAPPEPDMTELAYCLYEPLTGSVNEIVRAVTVIGKSFETNIRINNRFVSRIHAVVIRESDGYYVEDVGTDGKGSTNGTRINGIRIVPGAAGRTKLKPGDNIRLGNTEIIFDLKK